uniref:Uncharacterized protein n=1 Tax=viral metagenome TaxID=1070528 RepID=A0A6H1ZZF6_9ZZZZ
MQDKTLIKLTAISALALLESVAMITGHDGALFLPVAALIGAIAGYQIRDIDFKIPGGTHAEK